MEYIVKIIEHFGGEFPDYSTGEFSGIRHKHLKEAEKELKIAKRSIRKNESAYIEFIEKGD